MPGAGQVAETLRLTGIEKLLTLVQKQAGAARRESLGWSIAAG